MFPSYVKLSPPKPVDLLIVNGCECEPYLNADNRLMIEHSEEILKGINIVKKLLDVKDVIFSIEDNKKEVIIFLKLPFQLKGQEPTTLAKALLQFVRQNFEDQYHDFHLLLRKTLKLLYPERIEIYDRLMHQANRENNRAAQKSG